MTISNSTRLLTAPHRAQLWRAALRLGALAATAGVLASGCIIYDDHDDGYYHHGHDHDDYYDDDATVTYDTVYSTIDAGQTLNTVLGEGAGLFVEYAQDGHWYVWTSCDTNLTGRTCSFQVNVASSYEISNVTTVNAETSDRVDLSGGSALTFYSETSTYTDGLRFDTQAGEPVELEVYLDGFLEPGYIFWYGDGVVHDGASGSPLVLTPSTP